jgi:hypothetical protein
MLPGLFPDTPFPFWTLLFGPLLSILREDALEVVLKPLLTNIRRTTIDAFVMGRFLFFNPSYFFAFYTFLKDR